MAGRTVYSSPRFSRTQHPYECQIETKNIAHEFHVVLPANIFRPGARGWSDLQSNNEASSVYFSALQFIGEMMKYVTRLGSDDGQMVTRMEGGALRTIDKVRLIVSLLVKRTDFAPIDGINSPLSERLFDPQNRIGVLVSVYSLDPQLHLIDLLRLQVRENARTIVQAKEELYSEEANAPIPRERRPLDNASDVEDEVNQDNEEDEDDDGEVTAGNDGAGPAAAAGRGGGAAGRGRGQQRPRPRRRIKTKKKPWVQQNQVQTPLFGSMHKTYCALWQILSLLLDSMRGRENHRRPIFEVDEYRSRRRLDSEIESGNPDVSLDNLLTLENALAFASRLVNPAECTTPQLDPASYRAQSGRVFSYPCPYLTWLYRPEQCSANAIATGTFPWCELDMLKILGRIVADGFNMSVPQAIRGIATMKAPDDENNSNLIDVGSGTAPPIAQDVLTMLSTVLPTRRQRKLFGNKPANASGCGSGRGQVCAAPSEPGGIFLRPATENNIKIGDLSFAESMQNTEVYRNAMRAAGDPVRRALQFVDILEWKRSRELRDHFGGRSQADCDVQISRVHRECRKVARRIEDAAMNEFCSLLDPNTLISDGLKSCIDWIKQQASMELAFTIHSSNLGVFGNMYTSMLTMWRKRGIATHQLPATHMYASVHTIGVGWAIGSLGGNLSMCGKYGIGKSRLMEELSMCCQRGYVNLLSSSSLQGVLVRCAPDEEGNMRAPNESVICCDEAMRTMVGGKNMSGDESRAMGMLASQLSGSSGLRGYLTHQSVMKTGDRLEVVQQCYETAVGLIYATNIPPDANAPNARIQRLGLPASHSDARSATAMLCSERPDQRVAQEAVRNVFLTLHALVIEMYNMTLAGGPSPWNDLLLVYLRVTREFLKNTYPQLMDQIRTFDTTRAYAAVYAFWTAAMHGFSCDIGIFRGKPYDPSQLRQLIPYMYINQEIAMYVIVHMIRTSLDPTLHNLLRWLALVFGHYGFVTFHKRTIRRHMNNEGDPDVAREMAKRREANAEFFQHVFSRPYELALPKDASGVWESSTKRARHKGTKRSASAFAGMGGFNFIQDAHGNNPDVSRGINGNANMSLSEFMQYVGDTIIFPLCDESTVASAGDAPVNAETDIRMAQVNNQRQQRREEQRRRKFGNSSIQYADSVLRSSEAADASPDPVMAEYLKTINETPMPYKYKPVRIVDAQGRETMMFDVNYVVVEGTIEEFAKIHTQTRRESRLSEEDVYNELRRVIKDRKTALAHVIPLVPVGDPVELRDIERARVELWESNLCKTQMLPVAIPFNGGIYILIEELNQSPRFIMERVLSNLCYEGTYRCDIILPETDKVCTHALKTFTVKPIEGRVLECSNASWTPAEENRIMPKVVNEASSGLDDVAHIVWGKSAERDSLQKFFEQHGLFELDPEKYTFEALQTRHVKQAPRAIGHNYPGDIIAQIKAFDRMAIESEMSRSRLTQRTFTVPALPRSRTSDKTPVGSSTTAAVSSSNIHQQALVAFANRGTTRPDSAHSVTFCN